MAWRATHLLIAAALCLLPAGCCTVCELAARTMHHEPSRYFWKSDARRSLETYHAWAKRAWRDEGLNCSGEVGGPEYESGFEDGFVDYVFAGGSGEPPPVPPRRFWNMDLRTTRGRELADQWFEGYRHGARVAREGGYRELSAVRSSLLAPAGAPYGEPAYGPSGSEPTGPWPEETTDTLPTPEGPSRLVPKSSAQPEAPNTDSLELPKQSGEGATKPSEPATDSSETPSAPPVDVPLTPERFSEPPSAPVEPPVDTTEPDVSSDGQPSNGSSHSASTSIKKGLFPRGSNDRGQAGPAKGRPGLVKPQPATAGPSSSLNDRNLSRTALHRAAAPPPESKWLPVSHPAAAESWQARSGSATAANSIASTATLHSHDNTARPATAAPTAAKQPLDLVPTDSDETPLPSLPQPPSARGSTATRPSSTNDSMFQM